MKPISPSDVAGMQAQHFPPEVIEAFNEHIAMNYVTGSATFTHNDVRITMKAKLDAAGKSYSSHELMQWSNVEELYGATGWNVTYDKPAFDETHESTFTFEKKKS